MYLSTQERLRQRQTQVFRPFVDELYEQAKQALEWEEAVHDIPRWVENNRSILGAPWSYESTGPKIEYGVYDIHHDRLPRPYLLKFVRDQTAEKSVIKCRQCLSPDSVITIIDNNGNLDYETVENLYLQNYRGLVLSYYDNHYIWIPIKKIWNSGVKEMVRVSTQDGSRLDVSVCEKIWIKNKNKFKLAQDLKRDDQLLISNYQVSNPKRPVKNEFVYTVRKIGYSETYDIEVDHNCHCFFANNILVSNSEFTETHINESLFYCCTRPHTRIAHIFPTDEMGDAISAEKIGPAIEESPEIVKSIKRKTTAIRRYPFKNGSMYTITGALKKAGGRAASRDILIFDEIDSMPESIFGVYEELLSHSPLKLIRKLSTPTVPDVGIDKIVKTGCEYEWVVKCPSCKKEQTFTFPENIINYFELGNYDMDDPKYQKKVSKTYVGCKFCKEYIDRGGLHYLNTSLWAPKKQSLADIHASYHVNVMMIPWKTGREITRRIHELADYPHQGMNECIGTAYMTLDQKLSEVEVRACERPWSMIKSRIAAMRNISAGVDYGKTSSWIVITANGIEAANPHRKCVVYVEEINEQTLKMNGFSGATTDHVKRVCQLVDLFECDLIVSDANGLGIDRNDFIVQKYGVRAWGAFFDTAEEGRQIRKSRMNVPQWSDAQRRVTFSKVNVWKAVQSEFRRQALYLPNFKSAPEIMKMFINHVVALGIQPRWSLEYEREFEVVVKMGPADHLADALMYSSIGFSKLTGYSFGVTTPGVVIARRTRQGTPIHTLGV